MFTASPCIRPAHDGDYEQLCALFAELDAYHRELRPEFFRKPEGPPRERAQLQALIAGPDSTILVACDGSDVVGFATLVVRRTAAAWVRHARAYV